jgi:hypothetical protein
MYLPVLMDIDSLSSRGLCFPVFIQRKGNGWFDMKVTWKYSIPDVTDRYAFYFTSCIVQLIVNGMLTLYISNQKKIKMKKKEKKHIKTKNKTKPTRIRYWTHFIRSMT